MAYKSSKKKSADPLSPSCKKRMYFSREEAEDMIRHIRETSYVKDLHAYQCPICRMWHLSSNEGG